MSVLSRRHIVVSIVLIDGQAILARDALLEACVSTSLYRRSW